MTRRQIVLTIDCEDERCPKCRFLGLNGSQWWCRLHDDYVGFYAKPAVRPEFCLAAEARFRALVEAGEEFRKHDGNADRVAAWDRAVKEEGR